MIKSFNHQFLWYAFALGLIAGLALLSSQLPFVADQAVAILAAEAIERGGSLYVDFWDNKMPGLFWFYWVAGRLFSFNELGVHLFEMCWMLAFSVALAYYTRRYFHYPWLSAVVPVAIVGVYYATAQPNQMTLVEFTACFPLFLCAALAMRGADWSSRATWYFLGSGLFAGIAVVFKLIFAPICIGFWAVALFYLWRNGRPSFADLTYKMLLPIFVGVSVILGLVVLKFWFDGALSELLWTAFSYPSQALEISPYAGKRRFFISSMYTASIFAVWTVPILVAILIWLRNARDLLLSVAVVWLITAAGVIYVQKFSWWGYHFFLLFPPLGILGVKGIEFITRAITRENDTKYSVVLITALLSITFCLPIATLVSSKAEMFLVTLVFERRGIEKYRVRVRDDYALAWEASQFLKQKDALPGKIVVFGDPLHYHISDREPAIPMVGWPWEYFLQSQWRALPAQIEAAAPPYIYVADREKAMMEQRKEGVQQYIFSKYVPLRRTKEGTWLQRKREFISESRP